MTEQKDRNYLFATNRFKKARRRVISKTYNRRESMEQTLELLAPVVIEDLPESAHAHFEELNRIVSNHGPAQLNEKCDSFFSNAVNSMGEAELHRIVLIIFAIAHCIRDYQDSGEALQQIGA